MNNYNDNFILKFNRFIKKDISLYFMSVFMFIFIAAGCDLNDDDDKDDDFTGTTESYEIEEVDDSGISGVVIFEEREDGNTFVTVQLEGTDPDISYPVSIREGTVAEEGTEDTFTLNDVDGETGISVTEISEQNGTPFTFDEFSDFDGHIVVLSGETENEEEQIVARADIGGNQLSGNAITYSLDEVDGSGVSGTVLFQERQNQNTLVTIQLNGTEEGGDHPANIYQGAIGEEGEVSIPLTNVDGATGMSETNIRADQTDDDLTFGSVQGYDGHVAVLASADDETRVAEGNIGTNFGNGGEEEEEEDDD